MCQFDEEGMLQLHSIDTKTTRYIAISHIWVEALCQWRKDIPGIDWEILVSPQKADFLANRMFQLVGRDYFWMDVLCVDQRSDAARLGVVGSIPLIYREAQKTIVIRENGGIQTCCASAIGFFDTWGKTGMDRFAAHLREEHIDGIVESWFERLWPLQEMVLSDSLLFTTCGNNKPANAVGRKTDYYSSHMDFRRISDSLYCAAQAWLEYGISSGVEEWEYNMFIRAFINNGFVTRKACSPSRHRVRDLTNDFAIHANSLRKTSKERDFLLAILPQYGWYVKPKNIKSLTFGELWIDCIQQAERSGFKFFPTVTRGMTSAATTSEDESRLASRDIPIPSNLGDFIKLFGTHEFRTEHRGWGKFVAEANVSFLTAFTMLETIDVIAKSMEFSKTDWRLAHRGDLSMYGMFPVEQSETAMRMETIKSRQQELHKMSVEEQTHFLSAKQELEEEYDREKNDPRFYEVEAIKTLNLMWTGLFEEDLPASHDWHSFERYIKQNSDGYPDPMLRLAALISCGFGTSAFEWSKTVGLKPAKAVLAGFEMLILLSSSCLVDDSIDSDVLSPYSGYYCVQRGAGQVSGRDLVLVDVSSQRIVGKFPDFTQRSFDADANEKRLRLIYPDQNWIIAPPSSQEVKS